MAEPSRKRRVALLGGGMAALTAAYQLSEYDDYEITVYQLGWRLGGQGASGRNLEQAARIEEHGLHIWFGFYENAFGLMRRCYAALGRPPGAPLASVEQAFRPVDDLVIQEHLADGSSLPWYITFPRNGLRPGAGADRPSLGGTLVLLVKWMLEMELQYPLTGDKPLAPGGQAVTRGLVGVLKALDALRGLPALGFPWAERMPRALRNSLDDLAGAVQEAGAQAGVWLLRAALALLDAMPLTPEGCGRHGGAVGWLIGLYVERLWERLKGKVETDFAARRLWVMLYLGATCVRGALADDVLSHGFDRLDRYDLTDWLYKHSILKRSVPDDMAYKSEPMQTFYDLCFHYEGGDTSKPRVSAGVALRTLADILFGYKGSLYWFMNAAMGDTVFAPLYEVLSRRGVRFKFFHRVVELQVDAEARRLTGVRMSRQVNLTVDEYDPLVMVKDLPAWPSEPLYDQIVEGEALREAMACYKRGEGADYPPSLERSLGWTSWEDCGGEVLLRADHDFDQVILGIGVGALRPISLQLAAASSAWATMLDTIQTVPTQAMQIWLKPDDTALGYPSGYPVTGGWIEPYSSLTDFGDLLPRENWPAEEAPHAISYACGVYPWQGETQREADARAKAEALKLLSSEASPIWPKGSSPSDPEGLAWRKLVAPPECSGERRFDAQYWRANVDPVERYVLSLPDTSQYRLKAGGSGFRGLILAGNWIDTGFNIASIETAVMSGMQAARVLTGEPRFIAGERAL